MTETAASTRSLVFERQMKHPPERIWRALTESHLISEWLMENDFVAEAGRRFTFRATPLPGWSGIANCEVLAVEPPRLISYRWGDGTESDSGLITIVTWTLTPRDGGTLVRMEQSGFRAPDELAFNRMGKGWPRVLKQLDIVAGRADANA